MTACQVTSGDQVWLFDDKWQKAWHPASISWYDQRQAGGHYLPVVLPVKEQVPTTISLPVIGYQQAC